MSASASRPMPRAWQVCIRRTERCLGGVSRRGRRGGGDRQAGLSAEDADRLLMATRHVLVPWLYAVDGDFTQVTRTGEYANRVAALEKALERFGPMTARARWRRLPSSTKGASARACPPRHTPSSAISGPARAAGPAASGTAHHRRCLPSTRPAVRSGMGTRTPRLSRVSRRRAPKLCRRRPMPWRSSPPSCVRPPWSFARLGVDAPD